MPSKLDFCGAINYGASLTATAAPSIIIDKRERNSSLLEALGSLGMALEFKVLGVGDYVVSDRVAIERKSIGDFEQSIMNGRLFDQAERLRTHYSAPIIIIEGERELFRLSNSVISGAMASLYIDYGIEVIQSFSATETAQIMYSIARHEQHDARRVPSLKGGARAYSDAQFQQYVIGNLPGIGPKLAMALLEKFGSIRAIAAASEAELTRVDKVGKKKAHMIHHILNSRYAPED